MYFSAPLASVILNLLCWVRFLKAWITSDIKFELSGINNLGSSVFLAHKLLHSLNIVRRRTLIMIHWPAGFAAGKENSKTGTGFEREECEHSPQERAKCCQRFLSWLSCNLPECCSVIQEGPTNQRHGFWVNLVENEIAVTLYHTKPSITSYFSYGASGVFHPFRSNLLKMQLEGGSYVHTSPL